MSISAASFTFVLACAYILGSIPFGLILMRLTGHGDIRKIGSGNIGATNVLRGGGRNLAVLTLLLDMLKGTLAVFLAYLYDMDCQLLASGAALAALFGHMYPFWINFRGGKGVATALGVMLALSPPVAVMAMLVWLASALILKISSASALIAIGTMPVFIAIFQHNELLPLSLLIIVLVFMKHADNIRRLLEGSEPKIALGKNKKKEHKKKSVTKKKEDKE
ncbi:MAG: glycerol-3-phosphate 1-O-acyltransferase PlsY [Alphaproteobacteria bacterium]|nr:glycerol-3-phosphate 1-O-acyltransferase PlsY [Alphaproteobacteria bacterium]